MIWILPNMTLHVFLYLVSGDESFAIQSTLIWILTSKTIHVSHCIALHYIALHCIGWFLEMIVLPHIPSMTLMCLFTYLRGLCKKHANTKKKVTPRSEKIIR